MLYKPFSDKNLSILGMGNMRLPIINGQYDKIDEIKALEIIISAFEQGINYFDTAYRYHGGASEKFIGKNLNRFNRKDIYIATKMPGHMMDYKDGKLLFQGYMSDAKIDSISQIFEEQLENCQTNYFDFYLLHNLCETSFDFYTNEKLGLVNYLIEQKNKGRIHHLGFSSHGCVDTINKFISWSKTHIADTCFEFVQIQLNYLDWIIQDAKSKYDLLKSHNLPVFVMGPCRGGMLSNFDEKTNIILKEKRPKDSISSWAFRFVKSLSNVQVTLSGMSTIEQLDDNIKIFSEPLSMTLEENDILKQIIEMMKNIVPCTNCRYCCEGCPKELNIPQLITFYNEMLFGKASLFLTFTLPAMKPEELPSACIGCNICKQTCPQNIDIPEIMKKLPNVIKEQIELPDAW